MHIIALILLVFSADENLLFALFFNIQHTAVKFA